MKCSYLVLDLETVVDPTLPPPPVKKDGSEIFPAAPYHQIVVMGAALLDEAYKLKRLWIVGEGKNEQAALGALTTFLENQARQGHATTVVTWNGRGFDLPVIAARCLRYGLSFAWYYQDRAVRHRYTPEGHFDVMDYLSDFGAARNCSLDLAARLIGMPGKMDVHGADVATMIAEGKLAEVQAYCLSGVAQTVALLLRTQLLRGEITSNEYGVAVSLLCDAIGKDPRLAPMIPLIDHDRLLIVPMTHVPARAAILNNSQPLKRAS
ncbi:MAG: ribonuclease H-like domain-containing protein [Byssovorax sp.]